MTLTASPMRTGASSNASPRISVVVPYYNAERYLSACVDGLMNQSLPVEDYEIILVDNNSTDASNTIASRYRGVTLLHQPKTGSYAARNMGIRKARADIIATIDPDCCPDTDWLEQIDAGMKTEGCHILLGHQRHAGTSEVMRLLDLYEAEKVAFVSDGNEKDLYFGYTNNMAFRRIVFDAVGLFPERVRGGDTMFVRFVVDRFGCDCVSFRPEMKSTHLEVCKLTDYYAKRAVYGKSNERLSNLVSFRPLKTGERWTVFKNLVRKHRLPVSKKLLLLALLAPGALVYEGGRRRGMFRLW